MFNNIIVSPLIARRLFSCLFCYLVRALACCRLLITFGTLLLAWMSGPLIAQAPHEDLQKAQLTSADKLNAGQESQSVINALADESDKLLRAYRLTTQQNDDLAIYNQKLAEQITHQEQQLVDMQHSIKQAQLMSRQVLPILTRMIGNLQRFVEQDLPFHAEERKERINFLNTNLQRSDLSDAEKFRQVLEAYKIEMEYAQKIESYEESIVLNPVNNSAGFVNSVSDPKSGDKSNHGESIVVSVLRVGRLALLFQTKDASRSGTWNPNTRKWIEINDRELARSIRQGLLMANNQAPIDLLALPIFSSQLKTSNSSSLDNNDAVGVQN